MAVGCSGGGGGGGGPTPPVGGGQPELQRVEYGRLVDVFGLRDGIPVLYRRDVVVGGNIADERPAGSTLSDSDIRYDFFGTDPDTLQPWLLVTRTLGSREFDTLFAALDDDLREVAPLVAGPSSSGQPFSVVPRNAAIRLTFSSAVGVEDGFFVERNGAGQVTGLRNTEAVQLLRLVPDPAQPGGLAFAPLPVRIAVSANTLVLDPVLLGTEGLQYQTANNPAGLPAAADSLGANLRIALALEGPLAIPSLREPANGLVGLNNSGRRAVVRDFRSGNSNDVSADLIRGFIRDSLPLRLLGEIPMYLERVDVISEQVLEITVFKNIDTTVPQPQQIGHEIDRGDVFRFIADSSGSAFGSAEVVVDPADDRGAPLVQHVRVRIRRVPGLETIDPRNLPGYPSELAAREPWLVANAPRAICVCEFRAGDGSVNSDRPSNFVTFSPQPQPLSGVRPAANKFVSPFAAAIVRFTKPVDLSTVKPADTLFFGMRNLTDAVAVEEFRTAQGIAPAPVFSEAKYRTPFLIAARVSDQDGSQTTLRLQASSGFYLDNAMRQASNPDAFSYFVHLISDGGVRDLAGNVLDLQGTTSESSKAVVVPFTLDTRVVAGQPLIPDNLAISVVRRFAEPDEDPQPSYFRTLAAVGLNLMEVQADPAAAPAAAAVANARTFPLEDLFGGPVYVDGKLSARPVTRTRLVVDNVNQQPLVQAVQAPAPNPPNGPLPLAWCPQQFGSERQTTIQSAGNIVGQGIQNPMNPFGCRLQTVWREVDLSLSRTNPSDFNLDVEQMYWAPFTGSDLLFDEFDRVRLTLGHSEFRPIPCVGDFSALPSFPNSGIQAEFQRNFLWNPPFPAGPGSSGAATTAPTRLVYANTPLIMDPAAVIREPNNINRYLPLPQFNRPYFVFRDETVVEQGGRGATSGSDQDAGVYPPHLVSPYSMGQGRRWLDRNPGTANPGTQFCNPFWNDSNNVNLAGGSPDGFTGGLTGAIGMPLLADFWTECDSPNLPAGAGYVALGFNGWQVSITNGSGAQPNFRVLSAGRAALPTGGAPICRAEGQPQWATASGGFLTGTSTVTPSGGGDNTLYWIMVDVLRRQSVLTSGFVDLINPHRVTDGTGSPPSPFGYNGDTRLGPYFPVAAPLPANVRPNFSYEFDPPLSQLPTGTSIVPQFRAAGVVDPSPWYWAAWMQGAAGNLLFPAVPAPPAPQTVGYNADMRTQLRPTAINFPLDPFKAGDAHIRKWDTRPIPGGATARNWWTYLYNRTVTRYVEEPNDLVNPQFTGQFAGPNESFTPRDVRYVNWRFVISSNPDANPPVSPLIETFSLSYRFEQTPP